MVVKSRNLAFFVSVLILVFLFSFTAELNADIIYLKNGRSLEGTIKREDEESVELDIGFGTVGFQKEQIERIVRSIPQEYFKAEKKPKEEGPKEEQPKEKAQQQIMFSEKQGHIFTDVLLNKRVAAHLLVDTGATHTVLSYKIGKALGMDTDRDKDIMKLIVADGRQIDGKRIFLESINVGGVEAKNVEVVIPLDEKVENFGDGVLGMSFLNRFNFKMDQKNKRLILEEIE